MSPLALVLALASRVVFSFTDPAIDESSGLVDLGSIMVTTNDSGDDAVLYVIDPKTGRTVGHTRYADEVVDVEALAPAGKGEVWAGDIGDNRENRPSVQVYRVPVAKGDRTVDAATYELTYPDRPQDAESLFVSDGRLYVVTKAFLGGGIYAAPKKLDPAGPNTLEKVAGVDVFATDAALFPDGKHVLVRGYGLAEIRTVPGFDLVDSFDLPVQEQGEGVSIGPDGRIRISTEGPRTPVLQVTLPPAIAAEVLPPKTRPSAAATTDDEPGATTGPPVADPDPASASSDDPGSGPSPVWVGGVVAVAGLLIWLLLRGRRRGTP